MSLLSNTAIEFRRAYNIPNDLSRRTLQKNLIVEEFKEFLEADQEMTLMHPDDRANCLKELADLVYVCAQYAENMDWDLEQALTPCTSKQYVKALREDQRQTYLPRMRGRKQLEETTQRL